MDANQCKHDSSGGDRGARLSLNAMWSVFLIPVAGAALAALVLVMEWIYYRQYYKSERLKKPAIASVHSATMHPMQES